jgi:hypothetical protein
MSALWSWQRASSCNRLLVSLGETPAGFRVAGAACSYVGEGETMAGV